MIQFHSIYHAIYDLGCVGSFKWRPNSSFNSYSACKASDSISFNLCIDSRNGQVHFNSFLFKFNLSCRACKANNLLLLSCLFQYGVKGLCVASKRFLIWCRIDTRLVHPFTHRWHHSSLKQCLEILYAFFLNFLKIFKFINQKCVSKWFKYMLCVLLM